MVRLGLGSVSHLMLRLAVPLLVVYVCVSPGVKCHLYKDFVVRLAGGQDTQSSPPYKLYHHITDIISSYYIIFNIVVIDSNRSRHS